MKEIEQSIIDYYNGNLKNASKDRDRLNVRHAKILNTLMSMNCFNYSIQNKLSPMKVLDIGCGVGALTFLISTTIRNIQITGIDPADNLIDYAKKKSSNVNVNYIPTDVLKHSGHYDLIILADVFEHFMPGKIKEIMTRIASFALFDHSMIYINIPDWRYLNWLKSIGYDNLQIIDEAYNMQTILGLFDKIEFTPIYTNIYGLDFLNQYNEYIFIKKKYLDSWYGVLKEKKRPLDEKIKTND